jgi:hypothetical protein
MTRPETDGRIAMRPYEEPLYRGGESPDSPRTRRRARFIAPLQEQTDMASHVPTKNVLFCIEKFL